MSDYISRQAAIDEIVNTVSEIGLHDNSEVARYGATFRQHEIIDIIEGMPPAQPHWIPCSERLPENDDDVLAQMNDGSMMVDYRTASSNGWFWAELDDEPVAWMPLPEPYKGVTE